MNPSTSCVPVGRWFLLFGLFAGVAGCNGGNPKEAASADRDGKAYAVTTDPSDDLGAAEGPTAGKLPSLSIGDLAPPLEIAEWFKGSQVDGFESGHVYVIEFWATWCGPCKAGMPHVSELQERLGDDVTIIGVTDEDHKTVEEFFASEQSEGKTWDDVVQYTIALDDQSAMNAAYLSAAGRNGIPCAFIVGKDGHIEWVGHPGAIEQPLQDVVDGNWNRDAFAERYKSEVALMKLTREALSLQRQGQSDKALAIVQQFGEKYPENSMAAIMQAELLIEAGRGGEASAVLEKLAMARWDESVLLNQIAWTIATSFPEDDRDLDLALRLATRSAELDEDAGTLDTIARVYYELENLEEAILWQEKAADLDSEPQLKKTLERYRRELQDADVEASLKDKSNASESLEGADDEDAADAAAESDAHP